MNPAYGGDIMVGIVGKGKEKSEKVHPPTSVFCLPAFFCSLSITNVTPYKKFYLFLLTTGQLSRYKGALVKLGIFSRLSRIFS